MWGRRKQSHHMKLEDIILAANTFIAHQNWKPNVALYYATLGKTNVEDGVKETVVQVGDNSWAVRIGTDGLWEQGWI